MQVERTLSAKERGNKGVAASPKNAGKYGGQIALFPAPGPAKTSAWPNQSDRVSAARSLLTPNEERMNETPLRQSLTLKSAAAIAIAAAAERLSIAVAGRRSPKISPAR